jgi:phosphoribosyl-AMP cyclohydrolase
MNKKIIERFAALVKFDDKGLVPAVIQDYRDNAVLMVGYMNKESLILTLKEGAVCFWSRSRKKLWRKGEQSGNTQLLKHISIDCDGDCVLASVKQIGGAACHTGYRSCFYRTLSSRARGAIRISQKKIFDPNKVY